MILISLSGSALFSQLEITQNHSTIDRLMRCRVVSDAKRLQHLKEIQKLLEDGDAVSPYLIKRYLTDKQKTNLDYAILEIKNTPPVKTPPEFETYLRFVKQGDASYASAERLSGKCRGRNEKASQGVVNLYGAADDYYLKALENLEEILEADPSLREWLNRGPEDFGVDGDLSVVR